MFGNIATTKIQKLLIKKQIKSKKNLDLLFNIYLIH